MAINMTVFRIVIFKSPDMVFVDILSTASPNLEKIESNYFEILATSNLHQNRKICFEKTLLERK